MQKIDTFSIVNDNNELDFLQLEEVALKLAIYNLESSTSFFFLADCLDGLYLPKSLTNASYYDKQKITLKDEYDQVKPQKLPSSVSMFDKDSHDIVIKSYTGIEKYFQNKRINKMTTLQDMINLFSYYCKLENDFYKHFINYTDLYRAKYGKENGITVPVFKQRMTTFHNYSKVPKFALHYLNNIKTVSYDDLTSDKKELNSYGVLRLLKGIVMLQYELNPKRLYNTLETLETEAFKSFKSASNLARLKDGNNTISIYEANLTIKNDMNFLKVTD